VSQDAQQLLGELEAKLPGRERVDAARDALAATVMGLVADPGGRVATRCLEIIREGYMHAVRVVEPGGAGRD